MSNDTPVDNSDTPPSQYAVRRPVDRHLFVDPSIGSRRVLIVGRVFIVVVTLLFLLLIGRVVQLQTQPPAAVAALVDSQTSTMSLLGRRGSIVDRLGRPFATTRTGKSLFIDPGLIDDPATFSMRVAYPLDYDPASLDQKIAARRDSRYVLIDRRMTDERAEAVEGMDLRAVGTELRIFRDYPQGQLAGKLLGFVNVDGTGLEGLERQFNTELLGETGTLSYWRDSRRRPLWVDKQTYSPPADGQDIWLSIDATIQQIAEEELAAACQKFSAPSGELIVMDPRTGEILAMAVYPPLDPNNFAKAPLALRRNTAVTDMFEPGSIFKPFVWAAAVEGGYVRSEEVFDSGNGFHRFPTGRRLRDTRGHGRITFAQALVVSSNIVMGMAGERMGATALNNAVRSFGFGESTNSHLPGEVGGLVHPLSKWSKYSVTSVPMGQEIAVTPLQITRGFCAFANDGLLVTPTILKVDRTLPQNEQPLTERVLKPSTAQLTRSVMERVVTEGTGKHEVKSKLYPIWGKTGTAQVADHVKGGYKEGAYIGSFFGGAPVAQPRIVVGCVVHLPDAKKAYYGGTIAGPAFRRTVERTLQYLGEQPIDADASSRGTRTLVTATRQR